MIVHFIASKGSVIQEIEYYRSVAKIITSKGHTLAREWVEPIYESAKAGHDAERSVDWQSFDQDNMAAISKADLVIVEATKRSFFVGYGVAQAVHQKKPVLILAREDAFPGAVGLSASSDIISSESYTEDTLESIINKFLEENTIETKDMRFNFFIDRAIYNYLRWAAFKTGKTKAEVLRELVKREIDNKDY